MPISIPDMQDDEDYMHLAIKQARKAAEIDEVPVGAVLVNDRGEVIGEGYNRPVSKNDPTCHAEIEALRIAAGKLHNYRLVHTTLYVTIEPCIMCMGAIIHARVARVVFGAKDPKWGAAGSLYDLGSDKRLNHTPEVVAGVCEQEARELIQGFFKHKRSR